MKTFIASFVTKDGGQDLIEYALLAGLISLVAVLAINQVGQGVNTIWGTVESQVRAIPSP